jgi:membrane dipeptidase
MSAPVVVDTHTHTTFLPGMAAAVYRSVPRNQPAHISLEQAHAAGVHAVVAKAVGDPLVTRWHFRPPWTAVRNQLDTIRAEAGEAGARLATTASEVRAARGEGRLAVILGLEGADALGTDISKLDELAAAGVRVIVPVHLGDNEVGTTCLPWQRYLGPIPVRRRPPGLTEFGAAFIAAMNDLGEVVDGSHADEATLLGMVEHSRAPVICSHAGARSVASFERYLSDDAIHAVAASGGVVGLWPYYMRGKGTRTLDDVVAHARHIADLVGPEHVCLGTDMNGVPGLAEGYRDERDVPVLATRLAEGGFTDAEVAGIMGENFLRVLATVESLSR